jgi:GH43 family beta-xylosidase
MRNDVLQPLIPQRADPFVYQHTDGWYYFTASVPQYDKIELRRAQTLIGLADATPVAVWHKPDIGSCCELIWAPEIHCVDGVWCVYFAAAPTREIKAEIFQHRMYAICCKDANPLTGVWSAPEQIHTRWDTFCLDATVFRHRDRWYYLWAQKHPDIPGNSNLYLSRMRDHLTLEGEPVMLSCPEYGWECRGFSVNEGPGVLFHGERLFVTYSSSATDANYAVGLLWIDLADDFMAPANWHKSPGPVFVSCHADSVFGPGHNSFTRSEDGSSDMLVYHARTYTEIEGDPLWDPNRHTFMKEVRWTDSGFPDFGRPSRP